MPMRDLTIHRPAIGILGRILFTLIFFLSGTTHFTRLAWYATLTSEAIPFREFWVIAFESSIVTIPTRGSMVPQPIASKPTYFIN